MTDNSNKRKTLNLPDDITLPFFAYGIFKPGQLAYSKIKNLVNEHSDDIEINYEMRIRDGVPILIDNEKDYNLTKGSLITFKDDRRKRAYEIISKTLLKKLYEWKVIEIDGKPVNILFGVDPDNGSSYIESDEERAIFNAKNDPFFHEAIELIEKNLNSSEFSWNMESFFDLQMNYMLLWSAIDRYSSLKYNEETKGKNYKRFSKEKAFKNGIKKYEDEYHRKVYSTEDLKVHRFNANDPYETIFYYYTFRCNVVHRGKSMPGDYDMLKTAAEELLEIFKEILKDTFDDEIKESNKRDKNIKTGFDTKYDLKKLEKKFHEFLNKGKVKGFKKNEIELTEKLLEQQEALYVPMGYLSYFLVIEDEKPVLYVHIATRWDDDTICFVDETGFECYDVYFGDHKEVSERYYNHFKTVKKFKEIKLPEKLKEK